MDNPEPRRCSERRQDGEACRGRPVNGGTACPAHGGRSRPCPAIDPEATAVRLLAAPESTASAFLAAAESWG